MGMKNKENRLAESSKGINIINNDNDGNEPDTGEHGRLLLCYEFSIIHSFKIWLSS